VPTATTQTYVITDADGSYTLQPKFSVTPDFCQFEITATHNDDIINFDPVTQEIVIPAITDRLTPSNPNNDGSNLHEYPVVTTIIVTEADGTTKTETVTTTVVIKNPCLDSDYVTIEVALFDDLEYTVGTNPVTYNPHAVFLVKTVPIIHSLCGVLVYEPRYNGQALTNEVLTYATGTRKFTVSTDDTSLIGEIVPYSVIATLANYPVD
jgi:hypothetical protein